MNHFLFFLLIAVLVGAGSVSGAQSEPDPKWFDDVVQSTGRVYRIAVTNALMAPTAATLLVQVVATRSPDCVAARHAQILLAHIRHPEVFTNFEARFYGWRKQYPYGERDGFLAGQMVRFTKEGPETNLIYQSDPTRDAQQLSTNGPIIHGLFQRKVEKYTEDEVRAGIERNAAARQALMEHFLKFSSEDNTYEQCEVMDAIDRVWGSKRFGHRQDEPPSDTLILACFQDNQRPVAVRLRTARYLPVVSQQPDFQAVLLLAVTNTPRSLKGEPNLLLTREAMAWLKGMGDADALTVLLTQTNGPSWRTEIITNACRAIETRLKDGVQALPR